MVRIFVISWILVTFRFVENVETETSSRERRLFLHRPISERCDHQIIDSGPGLITSPNFGAQTTYSSNALCDWHIVVPVGQVIRLHFTTLNIQATSRCSADYLQIFDGSDAIARKLARICGDVIPEDILTTQNEIFFFFRSDNTIEGLGFNLTYSAEGAACKPWLHVIPQSSKTFCLDN
ncbi:hypothetical protein CHS0354_028288 [Potamilus streckersoni]|uniref:CUB domain-containing protein n=1 Tax=Potamilus streckersoni TaxID=2493646 RepID=A0AAE0RTP8_9BIVA|nr:hypothetical protein CHS0354_028288 [Potamilus streckersoni]